MTKLKDGAAVLALAGVSEESGIEGILQGRVPAGRFQEPKLGSREQGGQGETTQTTDGEEQKEPDQEQKQMEERGAKHRRISLPDRNPTPDYSDGNLDSQETLPTYDCDWAAFCS